MPMSTAARPTDANRRWGEALDLSPAEREAIVIQTKVGIRRMPSGVAMFDFSKEHILESVDGSLAALQTDYLDLLLLHRPDALVEPEQVAEAFDQLHTAGKVRNFGVSNHTPGQIELLKKYVAQPLVANQVQLSITHAALVAAGVASNMETTDQSISRDNGLLDYARLNDITLQAWSPFQKKWFDGVFLGDAEYPELNEALDELAEKYGVTPTGIAVAWITRHPANIQVVLGTTKPAAGARGGGRQRHPVDPRGVVPAVHRRRLHRAVAAGPGQCNSTSPATSSGCRSTCHSDIPTA